MYSFWEVFQTFVRLLQLHFVRYVYLSVWPVLSCFCCGCCLARCSLSGSKQVVVLLFFLLALFWSFASHYSFFFFPYYPLHFHFIYFMSTTTFPYFYDYCIHVSVLLMPLASFLCFSICFIINYYVPEVCWHFTYHRTCLGANLWILC